MEWKLVIIVIMVITIIVIMMTTQEYSEEDIHRAIGICAINSVTLEPRRLFQGPAKGQFKYLANIPVIKNSNCQGVS